MILENIITQQLGKPQSSEGVIDRMVLRVTDPENKSGFKGNRLCHSIVADYASHGKDSDVIVLLGRGDKVYHSIVADFHGNIVADSMAHWKPDFTGRIYNIAGNLLNVISVMFVRDFKERINK